MKIRLSLLLPALVCALSLSISALAQDNQKPTASSDNSQAQPASAQQTQSSSPQPAQGSTAEPGQAASGQAAPSASTQPAQDSSAQTTPASGSQPAQSSSGQPTDATSSSQDQTSDDTNAQGKKYPHDGKKDDINAIGNRKLDGIDWYSTEREVAIGKQYAQMIERSVRLVTDPTVTEYVNRIGQKLVRNSDAKVPFTIKVVDDDSVNAFALPGGFFYVNSGLILAADEEAELAGVMAHEIAHVCARHWARTVTRAQIVNLLSIPLIFVGGGIGYAAQEAFGPSMMLTFMKFSRGFEAEADYLGLQYMYKSGYDPNAFVTFFEKVEAMEKKKPGTLAKAFANHPQTPDRIKKSQEEIANILPPRTEYIVTTSEFDDVKARLAGIENRHKLDNKPSNKPTLRRTASNDGNNGDKDGDDRPTLHRRDDQ